MCVQFIVISDTLSDLLSCFWPCSPEIWPKTNVVDLCARKSLVSSEVKGHQ